MISLSWTSTAKECYKYRTTDKSCKKCSVYSILGDECCLRWGLMYIYQACGHPENPNSPSNRSLWFDLKKYKSKAPRYYPNIPEKKAENKNNNLITALYVLIFVDTYENIMKIPPETIHRKRKLKRRKYKSISMKRLVKLKRKEVTA